MLDEFLKYQHQIEKRANQLQQDMLKHLTAVHEKLLGKLATLEDAILKTRDYNNASFARKKKLLNAQREEVEKVIAGVYREIGIELQDAGADVIGGTAGATNKILNGTLRMSVELPLMSKEFVDGWFESSTVDGLMINDYLKKMESNTVDRITGAVRQAMIEGKGTKDTARMLRTIGIEGSRRGLEGLSRTAMMSASHYAKEQATESFKKHLRGWQHIATLDSRTCLRCAPLDNKLYKIGENKPVLPLHWGCRCVFVPVPKAKHEPGKRIARDTDGDRIYVSEKTTYQQWLKKQLKKDPEFVKGILGTKRFELFQSGKLTLKSMVADGRIRTLNELSA